MRWRGFGRGTKARRRRWRQEEEGYEKSRTCCPASPAKGFAPSPFLREDPLLRDDDEAEEALAPVHVLLAAPPPLPLLMLLLPPEVLVLGGSAGAASAGVRAGGSGLRNGLKSSSTSDSSRLAAVAMSRGVVVGDLRQGNNTGF